MNRNLLAKLILLFFVGIPTILLFQNCGGGNYGRRLVQVPKGLGNFNGEAPTKISGPMVSGGGVDVVNFEMSADTLRVVFLADKETNDKIELFAVNRDGSGMTKLSQGGAVDGFRLAGSKAVYLEETTPGVRELFMINLDGSSRVLLSGALVTGGEVKEFEVSPDQLHAVFLADKRAQGVPELYAVSLASPGTPAELHPNLAGGRGVGEYKLLNGRVLISGDLVTAGVNRLYSTGYDGSGFMAISQAGNAGGEGVIKFDSDPLGDAIVYLGDLDTAGVKELYLTDINASVQSKVSQPAAGSGSVKEFALVGKTHVLYLGDLDTNGRNELYQRDLVGLSAPVKLNPPLPAGGNVMRFSSFWRSVLVNGSPVLVPGVVYVADGIINDRFELFRTLDLNVAAEKISGNMNQAGDIFDYALSPDGQYAAYIADQEVDGRFELYLKKLEDSSAPVKLAGGAGAQDVVPPLVFSGDNKSVLFVADFEKDRQRQLYVTSEGDITRILSRARADETDIYTVKLSLDGRWAVYAGDQDKDGLDELFVAHIPGM